MLNLNKRKKLCMWLKLATLRLQRKQRQKSCKYAAVLAVARAMENKLYLSLILLLVLFKYIVNVKIPKIQLIVGISKFDTNKPKEKTKTIQ